MKTEILKIDKNNIDLGKIKFAAKVLESGGLVAFPTETVYGLGANALNEEAVKNIFRAKGRPSDNPLIVHIAGIEQINELVREIPYNAHLLMDRLWPGPITFVLRKSLKVPGIITGGLDTVAVRMPNHPIALALIKESGLPIAAPSANISGKPSPTCARHVIEDLSGKVDVIIDGDFANIGLESTVLDLTLEPNMILRPGGITLEDLKREINNVIIDPAIMEQSDINIPKSPGMKYKHYSPKAEVKIVEGSVEKVINKIHDIINEEKARNKKVGVLATDETESMYKNVEIISLGSRQSPETIAAKLFQSLREFDDKGVDIILAEAFENTGIELAIMNRLSKAAGYNIIRIKN